jgi:hypothetical protein
VTKRSDYREVLPSAPDDARRALEALDRITGCCWSVAIAAAPAVGFGCLERGAASDDKDVRWIVRENLEKARLARAAPAAAERVAAVLDRAGK